LGRFEPFRYSTKVDAKLAELVPLSHKFAKKSRVGILRNERTRSTPFDPKHKFWGVSNRFVSARKSIELAPLTHKFAKHSRVGLFRNERTRSTPLDPKLMFWGLSDRFVTAESRCKTGRTGAIITQVR
jgi:hypothetical protein